MPGVAFGSTRRSLPTTFGKDYYFKLESCARFFGKKRCWLVPKDTFTALPQVLRSARSSLCAHVLGSPLQLQSLRVIVLDGHEEGKLLLKNDLILEFSCFKSKYHQDGGNWGT